MDNRVMTGFEGVGACLEHQAWRFAWHVILHADALHANFLKYLDRSRMIRPYQPVDIRQLQCFEGMEQSRFTQLRSESFAPYANREAITQIDAHLAQIVVVCDAAEPNHLIWRILSSNGPPAVTVYGPMLKPAFQDFFGMSKGAQRACRIEQVGLWIAVNVEKRWQVSVRGFSVEQA